MNERIGNNKIYLLAKEAGLIEFEQLDWNPALGSPTYESVAKARKFAELIARRCMDIASSEALEIAEIDDGRPTFAASIATAGKIGRKIGLEFDLFGVED